MTALRPTINFWNPSNGENRWFPLSLGRGLSQTITIADWYRAKANGIFDDPGRFTGQEQWTLVPNDEFVQWASDSHVEFSVSECKSDGCVILAHSETDLIQIKLRWNIRGAGND